MIYAFAANKVSIALICSVRLSTTYEDDGTTIKSTYQDILDKESTPNLAIPKDETNGHYQDYLAWVAEGNTPDPAD